MISVWFFSSIQFEVILHRLKKLTKHRNADHAIPFLLRFLKEIPLPGKEQVIKEVSEFD